MGPLWAGGPPDGASQPHMAVDWLPLRCGVLSSLLEPFDVRFAADMHGFIGRFDHP